MNMTGDKEQSVDERYRSVVIVWTAIFFSHFTFLFIVYMSKPEAFNYISGAPFGGQTPVLIYGFVSAAFMLFFFSFAVKKFIFNKGIGSGNVEVIQTGVLVACCMAEMISLLGMLLAFTFSYQYFFFWFVLGMIGSMLHFPKRAPFDLAAKNIKTQIKN